MLSLPIPAELKLSDVLSGVSILSADSATKLVADMQYMEPYASTALNRKLKNILKPGVNAKIVGHFSPFHHH